MYLIKCILIGISSMVLLSCDNNLQDIRELTDTDVELTEVTSDVEILYSDSAIVKVKVVSPKLVRLFERNELKEIFPEGLHVEFYSDKGTITSYMNASYATRNERLGTIVAEEDVEVYNKQNDKLITSKLIWNEFDETLNTSRYVRITRPAKGDTIYGYGLTTDQEFSRFEIKEVVSKSKYEKILKDLN